MAKRQPKDFDVKRPQEAGRDVVDPVGAAREEAGLPIERDYPLHLARFEDVIGGPREVVEAKNAAEERSYRAQGYKSHHDLDADQAKARAAAGKKAPKAAKPKAATKPRNRKPKAPAVS